MSWNTTLARAIAEVIAAEANAIGVDTVFAPVVNMMPDPRFGRLQEGFGENPTITSEMGRASVTGLQGADRGPATYRETGKVNSLGKHYAAYGAATGALNGGPADVNNRTLHEVYLRPWIALAQAGVRALMPSHNTVNDIPAHGNEWLIKRTCGTFRLNFHHVNCVELGLRGYTHVRGAALSCLRLKLADMVLI